MRLSFLRHGIAVEPGTQGYADDSQRPLTPKGERRVQKIAKGMAALGSSYGLILSSPYLRAKQTADLVAQILKPSKAVQISDTLMPEADPRRLIEVLHGDDHQDLDVLLVGHEPFLSRLISTLLTGGTNLRVLMKKGGLCTLDVETLRFGRCASLVSLLTPRQMRRLA